MVVNSFSYSGWQKDERSRFFVNPTRLVWSTNGSGSIENIQNLLVNDNSECVVKTGAKSPPALLLDFGQELNGGICLELVTNAPDVMLNARIRFGESVSEAMGNPCNDHAIHDATLNMSVYGQHEFGLTGFRFLRIDFLKCEKPVHIKQIFAVTLERPYEYKGSFECSDALLNNIWQVGARSVHLCCQDYIYDGIKRDRLLWMGDIHPQMKVIAAVFGDQKIVNESIEKVLNSTDGSNWINNHGSYSLWFLVTILDWYLYTGNLDWVRGLQNSIVHVSNHIIENIDESGREQLGGIKFLDWAIAFQHEVVSEGIQALSIIGLKASCTLFQLLGDNENYEKCLSAIKKLENAKIMPTDVKQVHALRVIAGVEDAIETNKKFLSINPEKGLSPWYGYYVLQARAMANDISGSLDLIRNYWGSMISLGATTFWEAFDIDWIKDSARIDELVPPGKRDIHADFGEYCYAGLRHSLCHGWGGGPTAWMSQYILGINIVKPGCKKIFFKPNLGHLEYVKGTFPTPHGIIKVSCKRRKDGKIERNYEAPGEVEIEV